MSYSFQKVEYPLYMVSHIIAFKCFDKERGWCRYGILIWVQSVCKGYQQLKKLPLARKELNSGESLRASWSTCFCGIISMA